MKVSEIKSGYLLKLRCGNLVGVYESETEGLCVSGKEDWFPVECLNEDTLKYEAGLFGSDSDYDVIEVYGRTHPRGASRFDTDDRKLLWREEKHDEEKCECPCHDGKKPPVTAEEAAEATREIVDAMMEQGFSKPEAMAFLASLIVGGIAIRDKK